MQQVCVLITQQCLFIPFFEIWDEKQIELPFGEEEKKSAYELKRTQIEGHGVLKMEIGARLSLRLRSFGYRETQSTRRVLFTGNRVLTMDAHMDFNAEVISAPSSGNSDSGGLGWGTRSSFSQSFPGKSDTHRRQSHWLNVRSSCLRTWACCRKTLRPKSHVRSQQAGKV